MFIKNMMSLSRNWFCMSLPGSLSIVLFILLLFSGSAFSQADCSNVTLNEASKFYETGNFENVIPLLTPCVQKGFSERQRAEAYRLLAMTYLALDSMEQAKLSTYRLLSINPNFEPNIFDPQRFIQMVNDIKQAGSSLFVTSVSKKAEKLLEAPATVMVITENDIKRRGYHNLEEVFHDLPGFDIAKGNAPSYTNLYQRGYRAILTDRTLLLIDGVEENDLVSDNAPISRQYPITNIKRIEIIYGPASTMYGANAFVGVINIVTKENSELLQKERNHGLNIQADYGSWNSHFVDATYIAKYKDISFSLTGRFFESDEMDLSEFEEWDFDLQSLKDIDYYNTMNISGQNDDDEYLAQIYLDETGLDTLPACSLYNIVYNEDSIATEIILTGEGAERAYILDSTSLDCEPDEHPLGFDNHSMNWLIKGKLQVKDFTFGMQTWRTDEGSAPWYNDNTFIFRKDRTRWINWNTFFYLRYDKSITDKLLFTNLASYRLHAIDGGTTFETYKGYFNSKFSLLELTNNDLPALTTTYYYRASNQLRDEIRLLWVPSGTFDIMSGIEFRSGLIQGDYLKSPEPYPDETGAVSEQGLFGTDHFRTLDLGIFSQATLNLFKTFHFTLGARIDNNKIRQNGGYGTVFNPRVAIVYTPGSFVFKAIYAEAFKDASYLQKYATVEGSRELSNPTLEPERVRNIELSAYWQIVKNLSLDVVGYSAHYDDVVGTAIVTLPDGSETGQFQPIGEQIINGVQANAKWEAGCLTFLTNYTFTDPLDKESDLRISDIASHRANFIANALFFEHLNLNIRTNYVGQRKTGEGTSGSQNPDTLFDSYVIFHSTIGYQNILPGISLQLTINNILDEEYFDPGVREAVGKYSTRLPQERRNFMVKAIYSF